MLRSIDPVGGSRARLHEATLAVIGEHGLDGLTARRVAQRADVPLALVRGSYASATMCLTTTYDTVAVEVIGELRRAARVEAGAWELLRSVLHQLLLRMDAAPAEARLCFREILRAGRVGARHHSAVIGEIVDLLCTALERDRTRGTIHPIQVELIVGAVFQGLADRVREAPGHGLLDHEGELVARAHRLDPFGP